MEYSQIKDILETLCKSDGTSGAEGNAALRAKEMLEKFMPVHIDRLGNVVGTKGRGHALLLDAHIEKSAEQISVSLLRHRSLFTEKKIFSA